MTTEKSQESVTISILPSECFDEIFKHLKFDRRSLYSCLFVNRFWCRKVIPIIWRRPMPYNPERKNIINIGVFIPFFNEDEKLVLINEGIDISGLREPFPLFNYAQYIHILDIGAIERATETWLMNYNASKLQSSDENLDSLNAVKDKSLRIKLNNNSWKELEFDDGLSTVLKTEKPVSRATSILADSLCKMFMRCALNLKYLILSADKDIPKSSIFIDNEPGLVNLRKLKLRFYTNTICQHDRRGNLYDLLKSLPNICNGLVHLDINRIKIPNYIISEILAGLIRSQPELTYCRFYKVYGDTSMLISVLPVHKLTNLVLDDMIFTDISLAPLSHCTKLEALVLRKCRYLTLEKIQPILKASIKLKFLHLSELPKVIMKAIISKASDTLEQVSVRFTSVNINEGLETLANRCHNITHLSLSTNEEQVNISTVISLINRLKNLSHLKLSFDAIYGVELDNEFSNLDLEKLQYLELINMDVKVLKGYLSKCRSPLSTVIMGVDIIEERHINMFLEFSKSKNTLKWVGFDTIHSLDKYLEICQKLNELAEGYFQVFPAKQVRIREKYF